MRDRQKEREKERETERERKKERKRERERERERDRERERYMILRISINYLLSDYFSQSFFSRRFSPGFWVEIPRY